MPRYRFVVMGTAAVNSFESLFIFDLNRFDLALLLTTKNHLSCCVLVTCCRGDVTASRGLVSDRRGAGWLDVMFLNPQQVLSAGYDSTVRLWDLRMSPDEW